ncbi:MAG TPA: MaoC family dehydratase [Adhaeribacter sp.]|nr:MaoC family dehydratase [Adhaeribacter sp.]
MNAPATAVSIEAGTVYTHEFSFSQEEVNRFAEVTGDHNPVHTDAEYAAGTMFKRPIMHGFLGGSIFSKVFGTLFPGEGTIYLKQTMAFVKPMFVDTPYVATFTVKEVTNEKHRAIVETIISEKVSGDATIKGEATVMNVNAIK